MKYIYLNLKRFDITPENGGVNRIASPSEWAPYIVKNTESQLEGFKGAKFTMFFPEAHIIGAVKAKKPGSPVNFGCQSVFYEDTAVGGGFGAFTTSRTANSVKALGCTDVIIGHSEERKNLAAIIGEGGGSNLSVINNILNREIKCALAAGLNVLYCIGEKTEEQAEWEKTLSAQLDGGLKDLDKKNICIGYEPVWAIGPGKTPPDSDYITKIARFVKKHSGGLPVVYGGGLKKENAAQIGAIPEIDGGLIALTRFAGEIGFYPDEYIEIIKTYFSA